MIWLQLRMHQLFMLVIIDHSCSRNHCQSIHLLLYNHNRCVQNIHRKLDNSSLHGYTQCLSLYDSRIFCQQASGFGVRL